MEVFGVSLFTVAGMAGTAVYLGAYAALQGGWLRGQGYGYAMLNATAAGLVLVSLSRSFNLSSALLQVAWITISLGGIARHYILTRRSRFSDEERAFRQAVVPELESLKARRLLDLAVWRTGGPNTVLTEAGEPVEDLIYLASGEARVIADGVTVSTVTAGAFVGEMSALTGDPAAATVVLTRSTRYLAIPRALLQRLLERDGEIRRQLQGALAAQVARQLATSNRTLAVEMRRHRHVPAHLEVTLHDAGGGPCTWTTQDISRGGFFLRTETPPPQRRLVTVEISMPASDSPLRLLAVVVSRLGPDEAAAAGRSPGAGLNLYALDPAGQRTWEALVEAATIEFDRRRQPVRAVDLAPAWSPSPPRLSMRRAGLEALYRCLTAEVAAGRMVVEAADPSALDLEPGTRVEVALRHPEDGLEFALLGKVEPAAGAAGQTSVALEPLTPSQHQALQSFLDPGGATHRARRQAVEVGAGDPLLA